MVYGNQSIIFLFLLEKYGGSGKKAAVLRLDKAPAPYKVQQQDSQAKEKKNVLEIKTFEFNALRRVVATFSENQVKHRNI